MKIIISIEYCLQLNSTFCCDEKWYSLPNKDVCVIEKVKF